MNPITEIWFAIQGFIEAGGGVLYVIALVTFWMWALMLGRIWYFGLGAKRDAEETIASWKRRSDRSSWYAHQVRRLVISEHSQQLHQSLRMINTLITLCPLLGLLGTVTGMIEIFDVMAISGSGNPRAMAGGVTKATIPTMAGMVAALSGMILAVRLERHAQDESERVADSLSRDDQVRAT